MTSEEATVIKVAYLIDTISCDTSGTEKQLLETINRLDRTRFSPFLVCLYSSPWLEEHDPGCPCTVLEYRGFLKQDFPRVIKVLALFLRKKRIDILQTFFEDSIFVAYLAATRVQPRPCLLSSRRDIGLGDENQPWYHRLYPMILPWVNRGFQGILTNSKQVREYACKREKTSPDKFQVIYNGVELPQKKHPVSPHLFNLNSEGVWLVMAASLTPVKRHDVFIQALALIESVLSKHSVHCILLGKGPCEKKLRQQVHQLHLDDVVHFAGAVTNVNDYLLHGDIGVLCSDREGLSNAVLEYMAAGLPVVATAVGGNVELVSEHNGVLVPPGDPQQLAQALGRLIEQREQRLAMGKVSRQVIQDRFSWERSMETLCTYYETLVRNRIK